MADHNPAWRDVQNYGKVIERLHILRLAVRRNFKRWRNAKLDLRKANERGSGVQKMERKLERKKAALDFAKRKRKKAKRSLLGVADRILHRNRILLIHLEDLKVAEKLIDEHDFQGEIQVFSTEEGRKLRSKLREKGIKARLIDEADA